MRNLSKKITLILIFVFLILGILFIYLTTKVDENLSKVFLVITIIDFILLTFSIQSLGFKSFKPKKINYPQKDYKSQFEYNQLDNVLIKNGFQRDERIYGNSYLYINDKTAIKVTLIDDFNSYFNNENNRDNGANKSLEKCNKFVGLEIFKEVDEVNLDKIPLFTIQGKNVYFTALLYQDNKLFKCLNYELPQEDFIDAYNKVFEILKMDEEDDLNVEQ